MREMGQSAWLNTSSLTLQGLGRRVNVREIGKESNDWILWGNIYSVWRPRTEDLERLSGKARRNKTTPMRSSVSCLAPCGTTISAGEDFEGLTVWPNEKILLQDAQNDRPARPQRAKARGVPVGYVEGLNDARTTLADVFSILTRHLESASQSDPTQHRPDLG